MPRMILLGVGTAVPDPDRECTHMVWDASGGPLLIDAGGNAYGRLLKAGIDPQSLRGILLTHSDADHVYGFPILLTQLFLAGRREPIAVYGLPPTLARVQALIDASAISSYMLAVTWVPVQAGDDIPLDAPYRLRTTLTEHGRPCIGLRFEDHQSGRTLVYSADTQPCESVAALAHGADVLIHEATVREEMIGHSTPRQVGAVAARAGVGRVVLVHFSPRWTMPEAQAVEQVRAGGFDGPAAVGQEGQVIEL